jgi:hypothetical protein
MRKFSMKLGSRRIVSASSFYLRFETADVRRNSLYRNPRDPDTMLFVPTHPLVSTEAPGHFLSVHAILGASAAAKIFLSIIQSIVIFVVAWASENVVMHPSAVTSARIKTLGVCTPPSLPVSFIQAVEVFGVHNCILISCKRDKTIGFTKRLHDCMSFHAFFHRLTSNELVMQPLF